MRAQANNIGLLVNRIAGGPFFIGVALMFSWALYAWGDTHNAILFLAANLTLITLVGILKIVTNVKRPARRLVDPPLPAFPSGHAAASMFLAFSIPYFTLPYSTTLAIFFAGAGIILTALISSGRLVLQVHTKTQVIAGLFLGFLIPALVIIFHSELLAALKNFLTLFYTT